MAFGKPDLKDYENAKTASGLSGIADMCGQTQSYHPPTLGQEAEKHVIYHRDQADKFERAATFLREHPEFDEFVRLVRSGSIQF
jgi:hypothetical protein